MANSAELTLAGILQERARTDHGPFAIFSEGSTISAVDLLASSDGVAAVLARAGATRGTRIIVLGVTGPELLATISACWRLGVLICPAEAFLAHEALQKVVDQFRPDFAIADLGLDAGRSLADLCAARNVPVFGLDEATASSEPFEGPLPYADDPALCIFTSGSTGMPKGVVLSQRNLVIGAQNIVAAKGISARDRVLCVLPMSHLNGLETTFVTPLVTGGSVVYLQGSFQPERALQLIDEHRCTWFSAVPTQYAYLLKPPVPRENWSLESLRFCRSASAPLPVRVRAEFEEHYGVPIIETMGMTETAGQIFCNPLPPERPREGSVGRPFGFEVRIAGEGGEARGVGEVGEIQVRGDAVMLGYLDNPEETRSAFDGTWLRSGDLGSFDADGFWYIRGRIKDIAIFSGINISLRALELAIQDAGLTEDIACIGTNDYFFGETIVAYIVAPTGQSNYDVIAANVAKRLRELLPSQQALREIRVVSRFPRSSAGKVLKGRLGEEAVLYSTAKQLSRDPHKLLADVLHISEHQIHDGLELGLLRQWDSLGHVALVLAVESLFQRYLSVPEIVALTTFRGLKAVLAGTVDTEALEPGDIAEELGALDGSARRDQSQLIALMRWNRLLPEAGAERSERGLDMCSRYGHAASNRVLTFSELVGALQEAGLHEGDTALVHSDVSALGLTEVGHDRDAALDFYHRAFQTVLGPSGTLCMCTSFEDYGRYGSPFVLEESPSRLGALSEHLRNQPGAIRSLHPIVSVTSLGPNARHISGEAHFEGFGYDSPWGRLHRSNAKLLTMGMGHYPEMGLTFLHYIEHAYGVPYQYVKLYSAPVFAGGSRVTGAFTMSVRYLDFGITYDTNRFKNDLVSAGCAKIVPLATNSIFLTTAEQAMDVGIRKLRSDRYYFLKEPPRFRAGELPVDGTTGDIQYAYDRAVSAK